MTRRKKSLAPIRPCLIILFACLAFSCSRAEREEKMVEAAAAAAGRTVTIDFLSHLNIEANALAPQAVCADSRRNRVFAACANSSAVAVIDGAAGRTKVIPVGSRMPRRFREAAMAVSAATGRLFLAAGGQLIVVDPERTSARVIALPDDYETVALHGENDRAYLVGRTCSTLAIVDLDADLPPRFVSLGEASPELAFSAASAPPAIRRLFVDAALERIYVVDGTAARLFVIDARTEALLSSRDLPVDPHPRWHFGGFDPSSGRIFVALENGRREAAEAIAIDPREGKDRKIAIPKGHTEPAGVKADPERGELFVCYDNNTVIHAITFDNEPEIEAIDLPERGMGVNATVYDPRHRTLYAATWMQAALYVVDMESRKRVFTVPFFPVYPHMNSMALNEANGKIYVPSGSTAVNGTFGSALTVFDPRTLTVEKVLTGWGPVSLAPRPGSDDFYVACSEQQLALVRADGSYSLHPLPHPYPRELAAFPGRERVHLVYGPHSSMWPSFYIGGTRTGILSIGNDPGDIIDQQTHRLVQGLLFDGGGRLWTLQNTWGAEEPLIVRFPAGGEPWQAVRLPGKVANECLLRLLAEDREAGVIYAGRVGNLNTEKGRVYLLDAADGTMINDVEVGVTPTAICLAPQGSECYVANFDSDTVTVIREAGRDCSTIPVGHKPLALDVDLSSGSVYAVNHLGESLTRISGIETTQIPLPPDALPNNILVDQTTGRVLVTAHAASEFRIYDLDPRNGKADTIHTASFPYGEITFDQANAAFGERAQWGDGLFRITDMAIDRRGFVWVTDYLGGKLHIVKSR